MKKIIYVKGMHCSSCEFLITDALQDIGVMAHADHRKGEVIVEFDEKKIDVNNIYKAIKEVGYQVR